MDCNFSYRAINSVSAFPSETLPITLIAQRLANPTPPSLANPTPPSFSSKFSASPYFVLFDIYEF